MTNKQSPLFEVSDERLLKAFSGGSQMAFSELVQRYKTKIFAFIYFQINHQEDAEDLTQDVFIQLHRKAMDFRNESSFTSFLYAMAKFIVLNYFRTKSRSIKQISDQELGGETTSSFSSSAEEYANDSNPEQISSQKTKQTVFKYALEQLNNEERQLLYLYDHEGFTYQQISHILGINVGTVRSRLHTSRHKLLTIFKGNTDEL